MKIEFRRCEDGVYEIALDNLIVKKGLLFKKVSYNFADDPMPKYMKVIKHFTKGKEMFFGHYRTDGINITSEEWEQYDKEIPEHFKTYGSRYEFPATTVIKKSGKVETYSSLLTVGRLPVNEVTFDLIPKVFHYYLETVCFCPNIDWEAFVQSYSNYMEHGARRYAMTGFTDFLFSYCDSGSFSVSFDPKKNDPQALLEEIKELF